MPLPALYLFGDGKELTKALQFATETFKGKIQAAQDAFPNEDAKEWPRKTKKDAIEIMQAKLNFF